MYNYNRGTKYLNAGNSLKALQFYRKCLKENTGFKELYVNMGNCYRLLDNDHKAIESYELANDLEVPFASGEKGRYSLAFNNLGLMHYTYGDVALAKKCYYMALELQPVYGEASWNLANAELKESNCAIGWDLYEYRFDRGIGSVAMNLGTLPRWDGASSGRKITIMAEQGLGDKIMFARYLPLVAKFFSEIEVVCHESLDTFYTGYSISRVPTGDCYMPLCSLPRFFGVVGPQTYTHFSAHEFSKEKLNIGVVCSGSATHANTRNRNCPGGYMSRLSDYGNLYGLNPSDPKLQRVKALAPKTWSDTASYLLGLDIVVSVDTSIVHLAGTLGIPTIMVQPLKETDFRWGTGGQNVWYPSVDVVQNNNNWEQAFEVVRAKLAAVCTK